MKRMMLSILCILILATQIAGCSSLDSKIQGNELSYIKERLELGMTKAEVKERFGRSYTNVHDAIEGNEVWRFDAVTKKGYIVVLETGEETVDRSGLLSDKLSSQLFIGWTEDNVVKDIKLYYKAKGKIVEYISN